MRALLSPSERRFMWVVSAVMLILAFTTVYPILFTFSTSLKSTKDFIRHGFAIPTSPTLEKYTTAWSTIKIGEYFLNSSIVTIIGVGRSWWSRRLPGSPWRSCISGSGARSSICCLPA